LAKLPSDGLNRAREDVGLSHGELWLRYFELGGMSTGLQLEAFLYGALEPSAHDYDVIALAVNERLAELESSVRIAYSDEEAPEEDEVQ
jgi:hypothetical protein